MSRSGGIVFAIAALLSVLGLNAQAAEKKALLEEVSAYETYFTPLPKSAENPLNPSNAAKIELGRMLYFDPRLSLANDISCNSCHMLDRFGVDGEPTSPGHKKKRGARNSPTVYNAGLHFRQFWDGRAADLEEQAIGPILNPDEMAMPDEKTVLERLGGVAEYKALFSKAFPKEKKPLTYKNVGRAIGAFERTLLTPSRFDRFLEGDQEVLTVKELEGMKLFVEAGCVTCHSGVTIGGQQYQKLGLVNPYSTKDQGRFDLTKKEEDRLFFKVPSLRNVAKTAPYFHDGSVKTLKEAVTLMGKHQLDVTFTSSERKKIIAFLETLTGEVPLDKIQKPTLPGM